ncbi:MAG: glycosyltransferase family 4 protein [Desulfarculaceae bacterium]|nr:glycosyltransferase family 4 protein [Desulfarculaceae bacterium]
MKILHVISQPPDFTGSGKYLAAIAEKAACKGHQNFLAAGVQGAFEPDSSVIPGENTRFVRFDGCDLDFPVAGMSDAMPYESSIFSGLTGHQLQCYENVFETAIREAVDRFRPDIVHTNHLWIVSAIARRVAKDIPVVTLCHGTCLRQHSLCPDISASIRPFLEQIDRVMVLSEYQKREVLGRGLVRPEQIDVVGGGYNQSLFAYQDKPFKGTVELLYAGKLSRAKGVPWLLRSLFRIRDLPWRLHLAGDGAGEEKEECLNLAGELGNRVVVHGSLSHEKLAALMKTSHIFVLPSFFEGLPLVLMEALACGCRIVTTSLEGTREVLGGADSRLASMVDLPPLQTVDVPFEKDRDLLEDKLADAVKEMTKQVRENPCPDQKRISAITAPYTWEKVFSRIEAVYEKALYPGAEAAG